MKSKISITLITFLILAGCVPSLHQLWTKETLVYDDAIAGKYVEGENVWEFVGDAAKKTYALTIHEKDDKISKLEAHLVAVGGQRFFDFYPAEDAQLECGDWLKFHVVPAHLFFYVTQTHPNLIIAAMNPDEVKDLLEEKPDMVKHEMIKDDRVVLTDTPENMQKFLLAGLKIEGFFGEPEGLEPIRDDKVVTP